MKICGDCLTTPAVDQRPGSKRGRCTYCATSLLRARNKRKKAKTELPGWRGRADQATQTLHESFV